MMNFARENSKNEIIGVFFGKVMINGDLLIKEAIPFRIGKKTEVHFKDQDYEKLIPIVKEYESKTLEWLGWFHSHPFHGDALYLSRTDFEYQFIQQQINPYWTAIVLNPYQIDDPSTTKGARAFRIHSLELKKSVQTLKLILLKNDKEYM